MSNPKTTIMGYVTLASAILSAIVKLYNGGMPDWQELMGAAMGIGLIAARDGSH